MELIVLQSIAAVLAILTIIIKPKIFLLLWEKTLGRRGAQLCRIEAELHPNGGISLRDIINDINREVTESVALQKAYMASSNEAIFITNNKGNYTWVSPNFQELVSRTCDQLRGKGWLNIIPRNKRSDVEASWYKHAIKDERDFEEILEFTRGPSEKPFKVLVHATRMRNNKGKIIGYFGLCKPQ